MHCNKCGKELKEGARFCPACGTPVAPVPPTQPAKPAVPQTPQHFNPNPNPQKPSSNVGKIIAIICIPIIGFFLIGLLVFFLIIARPSGEPNNQTVSPTPKPTAKPTAAPATPEPVVRPAIEDSVNQLISSYGVEGSVAVSVLDNITGEQFICAGANEQYAAWGFYLPVYMAFCDRYPGTSSYVEEKQNMLSHDAGKCNTAANFAIDSFGGTDSITSYIRQTLGYSNTRYGRKFGQTNATDDNYTTAYDAAIMLNQFNSLYNSYDLCYNPSSFGIAVPDGASMYAQLGTENISVKNNLNVFAIMHGYSADYSIVILTKNNASGSGIVNAILQTVHTQMEAYAE